MTIKFIKIYSERNSESLKISKNLQKNINIEILSPNYKYGWQHGEPLFNFNKCHFETLFICVIRNVDEWLTEMYNNHYHIKKKEFNDFITTNTEIVEKKMDHDTIINPFEQNKTLLELRYTKYNCYKNLLKFKNCIVFNLDYYLDNQIEFYNILKNTFNIVVNDNIEYLSLKKIVPKDYDKKILNKDLENEINNINIKFNKYNFNFNEYYDILRELIVFRKEYLINKKDYPEVFYIGSTIQNAKEELKKYKDKSCMVFFGYNHFENRYQTDIFTKIGIKFIDFVNYLGIYYNFKPLVLFNIENQIESKINLINYHINNKCYLKYCPFCSTKDYEYKCILHNFVHNQNKLSECNTIINNSINNSINNQDKFNLIFNEKLINYEKNKMIDKQFFNLQILQSNREYDYQYKPKYFLGVLTRCKDERYLNDFITHYFKEGVDKIHIIDDNSKDKNIYNSCKNNDKVTIHYENNIIENNVTLTIYKKIRYDFEWLIFVDIDEFISTRNDQIIRDELISTFKEADCVKVPWILMGFKNQEKYPKNLLCDNIYRMNYDIKHATKNNFKFRSRDNKIEVKCIFRPKFFSKISIKNNRATDHYPIIDKNYKNLNIVDSIENKKINLDPHYLNLTENKINSSFLLCYHYRINSIEHAQDKINNNVWYQKYKLNDIVRSDCSEIIDETLKNKSIS